MSTEKIDKTKQNIGLSQLDDKEKKQLFNRFVEAGGKVINEGRRKGQGGIARGPREGFRKKSGGDSRNGQAGKPAASMRKESGSKPEIKSYRVAPAIRTNRNSFIRLLERWRIRLRLFFMGVTEFSGSYLTTSFLEKLNLDLKTALQELQIAYIDLFRQVPRMGTAIAADLDKLNPLYYEIIEMSGSVFDRTLMSQISEHYNNFPHIAQKADEIREPLMAIFKKLYVLYPYQDHILYAFEKAINIQMRLEKGKSSIYSYKKRKVKNNLYIVFRRLFKVLYWLFCDFQGEILPMPGLDIERILSISPNDRPGRRERAKIAPDKKPEKAEEAAGEAENPAQEQIPEEIEKGLDLMYRLDTNRMRSQYERDNEFQFVKDTDKILMAHMLFKEFDKEYSFILTTNKIKYNVQFTQEGKVDYRLKLTDIYNDLRSCMNVFKDYADVIAVYEKLRNEKPVSNAQYIEYTNRLSAMDKKKNLTGKNVRMAIRAYMEKVAEMLKILVADMSSPQKIIQNPQEILSFESGIEGSKKMENKKVYEAITAAFYYASAFVYRLGPSGDLHGELEFNEEELKKMRDRQAKEIEKERLAVKEKKPEETAKAADDEKDSVIDELDDLF